MEVGFPVHAGLRPIGPPDDRFGAGTTSRRVSSVSLAVVERDSETERPRGWWVSVAASVAFPRKEAVLLGRQRSRCWRGWYLASRGPAVAGQDGATLECTRRTNGCLRIRRSLGGGVWLSSRGPAVAGQAGATLECTRRTDRCLRIRRSSKNGRVSSEPDFLRGGMRPVAAPLW